MAEPGDHGYEECLPPGLVKPAEVVGASNGHSWIRWKEFTCCSACGIVRRADDQNKPCRGVVSVGLR